MKQFCLINGNNVENRHYTLNNLEKVDWIRIIINICSTDHDRMYS